MEVTPVEKEITVTITGNTATAPYDGNTHSVEGYKVTGVSDVLYAKENVGFTGIARTEGTAAGTYYMNLSAAQFTNTSANFANVKFIVTDGYLTINPKSIIPDTPDTPEDEKTGIQVTKPENSKYDGEVHQNKPTVTDTKTGATLTEGTDYTFIYSDDVINAGKVTVTVKGTGNYTGEFNTDYEILKT